MYCQNCGSQIGINDKFCQNCGSVTMQPNSFQVNPQISNFMNNNENYNVINKLDKKTKIIGILSIILVFIFQILIVPLAIVGVVFGAKYKKQTNKNHIGTTLSWLSIILAVPIFLFYSNVILYPNTPVVGTWNCGDIYTPDEYLVTFKLDKNKTFTWSKYGDSEDNYIKGKYEFKDLNKKNNSGDVSYYSIILKSEKFVMDGELQKELTDLEYEMGVGTQNDSKGNAVLMNVQSYNLYSCKKEK
jgi:hypothetical protein